MSKLQNAAGLAGIAGGLNNAVETISDIMNRKREMLFRTTEREATQTFEAEENKQNRNAQLEAADIAADASKTAAKIAAEASKKVSENNAASRKAVAKIQAGASIYSADKSYQSNSDNNVKDLITHFGTQEKLLKEIQRHEGILGEDLWEVNIGGNIRIFDNTDLVNAVMALSEENKKPFTSTAPYSKGAVRHVPQNLNDAQAAAILSSLPADEQKILKRVKKDNPALFVTMLSEIVQSKKDTGNAGTSATSSTPVSVPANLNHPAAATLMDDLPKDQQDVLKHLYKTDTALFLRMSSYFIDQHLYPDKTDTP